MNFQYNIENISWIIKSGKISPDNHCSIIISECFGYDLAIIDQNHASRRLLCRKDELVSWISVHYPGIDLYQSKPELRKIILMQALSYSALYWEKVGFVPGSIQDISPDSVCSAVQKISAEGYHLSMGLDGWSEDDIEITTQGWNDFDNQNSEMDVFLPVIVGYTDVNLKKTLDLKAGDGIVLRTRANDESNSFFLIFGNKKVSMSRLDDSHIKMEGISEMQENLGMSECPFEDLPITISAEVGQIKINLAKLLMLQPGDVIEGRINTPDKVKLLVNGNCIGYGSLLSLNETLVVKVSTIYSRHAQETTASVNE
ncbi:hypothetical protein D5952_14145 [Salmonella enterica subsp. enterica]|nr:hypothetical protein [Salmonella enterica subsp. enterica serovar Bonn]EBZ5939322.1 hypothetical protein [Salmonella enterica subsp. enterica serovar Muenchen]MLZ41065.1 hypothetical protein [Salmonella enterica subsp. enterica serovar Bonn]